MPGLAKICGTLLALCLLNGAAAAQDRNESVTVTGQQPQSDMMKGDLDPTKKQLSGLTGEKISRDIDPLDRVSAFQVFAKGLSGPLGEVHEWYGVRDEGRFRPTREFYEAGLLCRDFTEETKHRGDEGQPLVDTRPSVIMGTACREADGWHFR